MSKRTLTTDLLTEPTKRQKQDGGPMFPFHIPEGFQASRVRLLSPSPDITLRRDSQCVVLWMSRDQRVEDNHAFQYAQGLAAHCRLPLKVVFNLVPSFLQATLRQYAFMIDGLREVEVTLRGINVPMHLLMGDPLKTLPAFVEEVRAAALVTDFSPLRVSRAWVKGVSESLCPAGVPMMQVDAHNIVPCWVASPKLEYAARTLRPKLHRLLPQYTHPIAPAVALPTNVLPPTLAPIDWDAALASLQIDRSVAAVGWLQPGPAAAMRTLQQFLTQRLQRYGDQRNDPNEDVASNLSPYLHFGHVYAGTVLRAVRDRKAHLGSADAFVEEMVVRRELSDNFCYYNPQYDSLDGCNDWAKETLRVHSSDRRPVLYSRQQLEQAMTYDDLWNAAQLQMTTEGKMHGFLRMYWAKKILEWSVSPEEALSTAIYLNDKYELDGRDPNGYVGCMWSIGGIHDQGWGERQIFGKIRFMNYKGCQRKFDVKKFVGKYRPAAANAVAAASAATR